MRSTSASRSSPPHIPLSNGPATAPHIRRAPRGWRRAIGVGAAGVLLAAVGCGGDDDGDSGSVEIADTDADTGPDAPADTEAPGGETADPEPDGPSDSDTPDADTPEPDAAPDAPSGGPLLTAADLPDGFEDFGGGALLDDQPLCEGDGPPSPELVGVSASQFASDDFLTLVAADGIVTSGEAEAYVDWVLGELDRCDGVDGSAYAVDQLDSSTWEITISVDFGDGSEQISTSWMTPASADAVAIVHLLDGGLSDLDGLALLGDVAARVG